MPYPGAAYPPGVPAPADPAAVQRRDFHFLIIMYRLCAKKCAFFQRNKSLAGFVKYALRVKYGFAM